MTAPAPPALAERFLSSFGALAGIGRRAAGHRRSVWTAEEAAARAWFRARAADLGLTTGEDGNGNLYAWWGDPDAAELVLTGSHLDTAADGGAFDGALGLVSAFLALEELQRRHGHPTTTVGIAAFVEQEGARFGVPTVGSRLLTGALRPEQVRILTDAAGVSWEEAMTAAGADPEAMGPDPDFLARVSAFVELHIEQGRGLVYEDQPVGIISGVWPHGRWRIDLRGSADHAGSARLEDRRDCAIVVATAVLAARNIAAELGARATIGRITLSPNSTNVVAERASAWLDARAPTDEALDELVARWTEAVQREAEQAGVAVVPTRESSTRGVAFDATLSNRLAACLEHLDIQPTYMSSPAGHDAAILATEVPSAMLHVRNTTGVSHSPDEDAAVEDCLRGIEVLTEVLERLACT
jgi:N-carbamoyl-L-amino-acid hydrolase